jgi:polyisoprenyl-phosphate glycosyltransferase
MISVIVPCYNESSNIDICYKKVAENILKISPNYEIIFIDDGSKDNTFAKLFSISEKNKRVKVIKLSRNFGHQNAIYAGLENTSGDCVFLIDADLQDPPELFSEMYKKWIDGFKVVYGVRSSRKGNFLKILMYSIYHKIFNSLSNLNHKDDLADFCLIDKIVKDHLVNLKEKNIYFRGLRTWIGFNQTGIEYERIDRKIGLSKYNFSKLYNLALNGIVNFSIKPLSLILLSGVFIFILSVLLSIFYIFQKFYSFQFLGVFPDQAPGFYSIVILVLFFGSFNLICLGLIGEYIGRLYEEAKSRPKFIVDKKINIDEKS